MKSEEAPIISLEEYRRSRRGQAILLKRMIEQHLAEFREREERISRTPDDDNPFTGGRDDQ